MRLGLTREVRWWGRARWGACTPWGKWWGRWSGLFFLDPSHQPGCHSSCCCKATPATPNLWSEQGRVKVSFSLLNSLNHADGFHYKWKHVSGSLINNAILLFRFSCVPGIAWAAHWPAGWTVCPLSQWQHEPQRSRTAGLGWNLHYRTHHPHPAWRVWWKQRGTKYSEKWKQLRYKRKT